MPRATEIHRAGTWPANEARDTITLAWEDRHRRRIALTADGGLAFLLDLAEATLLADGDGLKLDDGGFVRVAAAREALTEVRGTSHAHLLRLAWHVGNRHIPAAIEGERILIRHDHVIEDMLRGLGAVLRAVREPFNSEAGAYAGRKTETSHPSHHHHGHDHDHGHHH